MADSDDVPRKFHWADYLVFALSLLLSLLVGVFFFVKDLGKTQRTREMLLGGQNMPFLPVAISIMASILNGVFVIGFPAEIYYFGPVYSLIGISFLTVGILVATVFLPMFRRLQLTSAYEYFDKRYMFPPLRIAVSLTFIISMLVFLAAVLYVPALAFSEVTQVDLFVSILATGVVCTVYTTIGGIKTVVWTDTLQTLIIIAGLAVLVFVGFDKGGGVDHVLDIAKKGNRLDFKVLSTDPHDRYTVWTQIIGQFVAWSAVLGTNQMAVQRYMTIPTSLKTQLSMAAAIPLSWLLLVLVTFLGILMYAHYENCDPFLNQEIPKADMIVPRYMMEIIGDMHGLPGLFTAAVFAAALSSVSSALNSMAAVILEDFVKPLYPRKLTDRETTYTTMGLAFFLGVFTVGLSFAAEHMGDHIVDIPVTIWATTGAPILGVFLLAFFVPWTNGLGCLTGLVVSVVWGVWLSIGGMLHGALPFPLAPIGTQCLIVNSDPSNHTTTTTTSKTPTTTFTIVVKGRVPGQDIYDISYVWYASMALLICLAVGLIASVIFNIISSLCKNHRVVSLLGLHMNREEIEPQLLYNWADRCFCYLPESCRVHFRQGEPYSYFREMEMDRGEDYPMRSSNYKSTQEMQTNTNESKGTDNLSFEKDTAY